MTTPLFFQLVALLSSASWALSGILWRRIGDELPPLSMNLARGFLGSVYLSVVVSSTGFQPMSVRSLVLLGLSGLLGIGVGDTFFFKALMQLGPRLTSLIGTLYPGIIAVSSVVLLHERRSLSGWLGICLTMLGVGWVLMERVPQGDLVKSKSLGIRYSLIAIASTTAALLLAKIAVVTVPAMEATLVRLFSGFIGLGVIGLFGGRLRAWVIPFGNLRLLRNVSAVVFVGVFGGFWLSLLALKNIDASIAGALTSTSPLFVLPLAAFLLGERITVRAVLGTAVAIVGVALLCRG